MVIFMHMRTTIDIPESLVEEVKRLAGAHTKTQAILWGLEELARRKKQERLWKRRGRLALNLDIPKSRRR